MRILQIVTYISPDGAYGGPVRVAINQAKALTALGHDVVLAATAGGFEGPLPAGFDGFPVQLFPARRVMPRTGFAGLASPGLLNWLLHAIRSADVVHVHLARDLVTLPAAVITLAGGKPLVVQTHGMVDPSSHALAAPLDRLITRPVLHRARSIFYLTDRERTDLENVAGPTSNLTRIPNGVTLPVKLAIEQENGPQDSAEVLYLARLHKRKRPMLVVKAAQTLLPSYPKTRFSIVGPDEGEGNRVRKSIEELQVEKSLTWQGALSPDETIDRMRHASIYVLPSTDEPFPMSVLEAMSLGLPVIVTDTCGLAKDIKMADAGIVCDDSSNSFNSAIEKLLINSKLRIELGANARDLVARRFSIDKVVTQLVDQYESL